MYLRDAGFDRMLIVNNLSAKPLSARIELPNDRIAAGLRSLIGTRILLSQPLFYLFLCYTLEVHSMKAYAIARDKDGVAVLNVDLDPYQFLWLGLDETSSRSFEAPC